MVFRRRRAVILDHEQSRGVPLHVGEKIIDVKEQQLNALLVERSVRQHGAQFDEQPQQMDAAVDGGHGLIRRFLKQ